MTEKVTFLHSGDIHLGAPMRGLQALDDQWTQRLQSAIAESFDRLLRAAITRQVDFVVIAGDSFDTSKASYGDCMHFFDGLQKLHQANIPVYLVAGNHDPYTSWAKDLDLLPPSAHFMGVGKPTFELFERDEKPLCLIGARSYFNQTWSDEKDIAEGISRQAAEQALESRALDAARAPFSVGIIHTGLDIDAKKAPAEEMDLLARGIDYWACGHLHKSLVRPDAHDPRIVFPGCIQGRTISETGRRGCFQVTLEKRGETSHASLEFVPLASVAFQKIKVDVSAAQTLADLARLVQATLFHENGQASCEDMVARVTLVGASGLHGFLSQPDVLERVRKRLNDAYPNFFCDTLVNCTQPLDGDLDEGEALPLDAASSDQDLMHYVQSELVHRGVTVPVALSRHVGDFQAAADARVRWMLKREPR